MKVYRYLSENELNYIQSDDVDNIGSTYNDGAFKRVNTHKYREGVKYLHFYKNKEDIRHVQSSDFLPSGKYYICEFDIPFYILMFGYGQGYYGKYGRCDYSVTEFKIPSSLMKSKYLKNFELDKSRQSDIDFIKLINMKFVKRLFTDDYEIDNIK